MAAVSLVSRKWRDSMSKDMWAVTTTSLQPSSAKDFIAILDPKSGLLNHLQDFSIEDMESSDEADERLRSFLAVVPENKLRGFDCNTDLSVPTLRTLLQRQRNLDRLDVVDVAELARTEGDDWMGPAMASIKKFSMIAPKKDSTTEEEKMQHFKIYRRLINRLTRLEVLCVTDDEHSHAQGKAVDIQHLFRGDDGNLEFSPLTEFALDGIYIRPSSSVILEHINLSNLQTLYISNCAGIAEFLEGLSQIYSKQPGPLSRVTIDLPWVVENPAETKDAIQRFLSTCPKLKWLLMDFIQHLSVGTDSIERHADTLEFLYFNMGQWPKATVHYDLEALQCLMDACRNITTLSINIPPADLGNIVDLADDFRLGPGRFDKAYIESRFESYLAILASHPKLKSLRFLDPPNINFSSQKGVPGDNCDVESKWCRVMMQNFADQVFRFMIARGSPIKLLVMQPASIPPTRPAKDRNSHQWPVYTYTKGCVTDARGVKTVVGVPLDKICVEMAEQKEITWN